MTNDAPTCLMRGELRISSQLGGDLFVRPALRAGQHNPGAHRQKLRGLAAGYFATVLRWIGDEPAPFDLAERLDGMARVVLTGLLSRPGALDP